MAVVDWSAETVEGLAPDAASVTAARKLARPGPWSSTGYDERALWGLCKGSGAKPYQTQVDVSGPAFKCSCPSRKFPCKHALALMLLRAGGEVDAGEPPAWVVEWLDSRAARPARVAGEPPRDPEAAARRAAEREARVAAGVEDLRVWLRDAVRGGLGAGRLHAWDEWDAFAARLVDAQAPGAASRLRSLGGVAAGRPDGWPERLLSGLGLLHLLCEAHTRSDAAVRDDVRALLGWNVGREDVLAGPRVTDRWIVLARVVIEQERLRVQRTWLWGLETGRPALLLDFAPLGVPLAPRPAPGMAMDAALAFHPSATPLRALVAESGEPAVAPGAFGVGGAGDALRAAAAAIAANPWLEEWPVVLRSAVPDGRDGGAWTVRAPDGALPLGGSPGARWRLLAVSGGRPVSLFGLWDGATLTPLAAGDGARTVAL
ncbi:SWIM zinc finger family protein [Solirubrobacter soli]|uniref:SWIM zinc finger family protein n=1 Tax=Solirubrobacter soli TaxID=363832 RepID=UPI000413972A|nr:SWIM zinc finger family protein [Solirubrobacter soli]